MKIPNCCRNPKRANTQNGKEEVKIPVLGAAAGENDIRAEKPHCPRCRAVMQALCFEVGRAFVRMSAGCFSEGM
jgi:hypothetical protein